MPHSRIDYGAVVVDAIRCFSDTVIYYYRFFYGVAVYEHKTIENKRGPSVLCLPTNFVFFAREKSGTTTRNILSGGTVDVARNEYLRVFARPYKGICAHETMRINQIQLRS